ncbi:MAG: SDR family oxidoreductase [Flavobacteriales bacterium]|nr:SDR family oxidoreductase [Flavobacteriales bacterium]
MKTIVVTGAGSGMGRATAQLLSENHEHRIVLVGRRKALLEETLSMMKHPDQHFVLDMDIRNGDSWKTALHQIGAEKLNISAVFANAGIGGENHYGKDDRWHEIISTNLDGTYVTIMELLPYLKNSNEAFKHIVITSSCLARFGVPNYTAYCTAKTGLLGLTKSLAVQYATDQILVNAICPGWVETEMAKAGIQKLADRGHKSYQESFDEQMSYVPLNRISQPREIAELVSFLISDRQTSMTGQGIDINNGSYMI